ncbi:MAG: ATP-dependent RecD-like DNA helicase [Treponema sp.]|nr:ATP-dependent RecD-like DNA helicase [Treponema sp.]
MKTKHFSLRLAWHENGWNGHICKHPCENTYCIGQHSYPGTAISENRDLDIETKASGEPISKHPCEIPCGLSSNAFGNEEIKVFAKKPSWWKEADAKDAVITIPPYTACTWSYDAMYNDDVSPDSGSGKYDNDKRFENVKHYFSQFEEGKSLVFYYAPYSNPFSEEENENFVIVGLSRLKKLHDYEYYPNPSKEICEKYANAIIWQKAITSNYPEEGFCIPFWNYKNKEDILSKIVIKPNNRSPFKYASREVPADDAIDIINQMIACIDELINLGDKTENWQQRKDWLNSLLNELWTTRGPYPGLCSIMEYLGLQDLIKVYYDITTNQDIKTFYIQLKDFLNGERKTVWNYEISKDNSLKGLRKFALLEDDEKKLLLDVLPLFDLAQNQVAAIIDENRMNVSLSSTVKEIIKNPYIIFEQYKGYDNDDSIPFYKIDNGILPSPEYGLDNLLIPDSTERLRALCIDELNKIPAHSFGSAKTILETINKRLDIMPEWKKTIFKLKYFDIDKDVWANGIYQRRDDDGNLYLYLKNIYEDERYVENILKKLAARPALQLKMIISKEKFIEKLTKEDSPIEKVAGDEYKKIINNQADVCMKIFNKPLVILSGAAGTGKTTVIQAILENIERVHGIGTSFLLMAPTGKAAERIKNQTHKPAMTIHSFLAKNGWINENFTFKTKGGKQGNDVNTLIIDECSMIDLNLCATLFRAINWNNIQRLILIGDPNQLPAIGRGRVFADIIEWLKHEYPDNVGKLSDNIRQLDNKVKNNGTSILDLANVFIQERQKNDGSNVETLKTEKEKVFAKILEKGNGDVDKDLSVYFWKNQEDLQKVMKKTLVADMTKISGKEFSDDESGCNELWKASLYDENNFFNPEKIQIISPYRGEFYGTDATNLFMQTTFNGSWARKMKLDGIALFDKVIQIKNRPKSDMAYAYSFQKKANIRAEIYNGEIGTVWYHPFDKKKIAYMNWLEHFQVQFTNESRKNLKYNYGKNIGYDENNKYIREQKIEENLELAYAISVHKSQGSEFDYVYIVVPKRDSHLLSMELLYTALTRAQKHVTLFLQEDIETLTNLCHVEKSALQKINSSTFDFHPLPEEVLYTKDWFKNEKRLATLSEYFVRSKSEVIIANLLKDNNIYFEYETPLYASDGSMYLPDFTVKFRGETYYWEHVGRLDLPDYAAHWKKKEEWYNKFFAGKLLTTFEGNDLTTKAKEIIDSYL